MAEAFFLKRLLCTWYIPALPSFSQFLSMRQQRAVRQEPFHQTGFFTACGSKTSNCKPAQISTENHNFALQFRCKCLYQYHLLLPLVHLFCVYFDSTTFFK